MWLILAFQVLVGWYVEASDEDDIEDEFWAELKQMRSLNLVRQSGNAYTVVPMIKDYVS